MRADPRQSSDTSRWLAALHLGHGAGTARPEAGDSKARILRAGSGMSGVGVWRAEMWTELLGARVTGVLGPSVHAYADDTTVLPPVDVRVREVSRAGVESLAAQVPPDQWTEAGFAADVLRIFALVQTDRVLAAANLSDFDGMPADIGMVTHPGARGRGLGSAVAAAATRSAIEEHGIARWRALEANLPSRAIARRLGFTDYGSNLVVRLIRRQRQARAAET
jgi:GNAT superfamily N-acetyltransferase